MNNHTDTDIEATFVAPRNFKNGRFLLNRFRTIDAVIWCVALLFTFVIFIVYMLHAEAVHLLSILVIFMPLAGYTFLLIPLGHIYHNMFFWIRCAVRYLSHRHAYYWEEIYKYDPKKRENE